MQVVVKMPHTDIITVSGNDIPEDILSFLETKGSVTIIEGDESVDVFETEWYKKTSEQLSPGEALKIYRERDELTLEQLGEKLGGIPKQNVSGMEKGRRTISKDMAIKLADIFGTDYKTFL